MFRHLRIAGLVLSSLTIVTVGLAQQNGSQGRVELPVQFPAFVIVPLPEAGKARLSRMAEPRRALSPRGVQACGRPPKAALRRRSMSRLGRAASA